MPTYAPKTYPPTEGVKTYPPTEGVKTYPPTEGAEESEEVKTYPPSYGPTYAPKTYPPSYGPTYTPKTYPPTGRTEGVDTYPPSYGPTYAPKTYPPSYGPTYAPKTYAPTYEPTYAPTCTPDAVQGIKEFEPDPKDKKPSDGKRNKKKKRSKLELASSVCTGTDEDDNTLREIPLANAFFQTESLLERPSLIDRFLLGQATVEHPELDQRVVDGLRNALFANSEEGPPMDLVSRNLQRGRDHGLQTFNFYREQFGLPRIRCLPRRQRRCFRRLTGERALADQLAKVYNRFDDIDPWLAGLLEPEFEDSQLGVTWTRVIIEQFNRFRQGDRALVRGDSVSLPRHHIPRPAARNLSPQYPVC